jgi:pimeloyl-ACP methyl ester carboxylesterase
MADNTVQLTIDGKADEAPNSRQLVDTSRLVYLHGLDSDSHGSKARQFREWFPGMLTPDFKGALDERMRQLDPILSGKANWTLIGSSFGGLMGTVYACQHPTQVRKLILLAPALLRKAYGSLLDLEPVSVPTTIIHGTLDTIVPLEPVQDFAQTIFKNLTYHIVEDDHRLHKTTREMDWRKLLA